MFNKEKILIPPISVAIYLELAVKKRFLLQWAQSFQKRSRPISAFQEYNFILLKMKSGNYIWVFYFWKVKSSYESLSCKASQNWYSQKNSTVIKKASCFLLTA